MRHTHFKLNRAFKVIRGHPYWCRCRHQQKSRTVCGRNVQLMSTLFLKRIWQRENGKFVDFSDPTQGLTTPQQETPSNIYKGLGLILPETRVINLFLPLIVLVYVYYFSHICLLTYLFITLFKLFSRSKTTPHTFTRAKCHSQILHA